MVRNRVKDEFGGHVNFRGPNCLVQGLFTPRYFRSSELKFPVGTFAPGNKFPGTNVPRNIRSTER